MRTKLFAGVAFAALFTPAAAFAQSAGSIEFGGDDIVVSGVRSTDVGGIDVPTEPKAKVEIERELILRQRPGQTINDTINLVPGVNFQNNDPWGSQGGTFTIRGFDGGRVSQTIDGIPLNDSGGYALYTNQQQDPETLASVNVNLGSTDVDSPTASAVGGTVNIRTRVPGDELGAMVAATYGNILAEGSGDRPFNRIFGMIDTGDLTGMGTKAFFSASYAHAESAFNNYGVTEKQQYNGRIYQELGANGDYISVAGHYNENRNNFFGSNFRLSGFPTEGEGRFYDINYPCQIDAPQAGVRDQTNTCGTEFDRRYNPSNTGNIRGSSRFTIMDGLILTVEPSFQYVKANGGGVTTAREGTYTVGGQSLLGYIGNQYYFGRDLNGDGDVLDTCTTASCSSSSSNPQRFNGVLLTNPSQTQTRRYGVIAGLSYELNADNRIRVIYTFDRAKHRQTGQLGFVARNGEPFDVFPVNDPVLDANGEAVQKRNRLSYATLHQVAADYRGNFFDDALTVRLGLRAPFFSRDLTNYCFTTSSEGFVDCVSSGSEAAYAAANPNYAPPQSRYFEYDKLLPNVGFTYNFTPAASVFGSYSQGLGVPGTDQLYDSFYFPDGTADARPDPETTDNFDLGVRYQTGLVQAQLVGWFTRFDNRISTTYDPVLDQTFTSNLGPVEKYGVDANIAFRPVPSLLLYVFGSYLHSEIKEDVPTDGGVLETAGKFESDTPEYSFGGRVQGTFGDLDIGAQVKHTGPRWVNDINTVQIDGYTLVDLDVRYSLASAGLEQTYLQLNVNNLFDELYIGSINSDLTQTNPFVNIGSPRSISASLIVGF
ncbi:TonB-dependent receptor [Sphingosinithalassobacter sp. LHW66-3]|uniref:TonB-dependent receptor n=1 Tax=Sphingosinithalassobacter sp. LHW66-3 TaxID=3424718 RepID=UPI003D6AE696